MKQNSTLLNEEISKIKKMMSIKDVNVVSEQNYRTSTADFVNTFIQKYSIPGTDIPGMISVLNNMTDKQRFIDFNNSLIQLKKGSFEDIINDEFEEDNSVEAAKIQQLLKSKFNIDANPGLGGNPSLSPRQRPFIKKFKITNFNTIDPNKKDGLTSYMNTVDTGKERVVKTGPNPTDFVVVKPGEKAPPEWKPEQAKKETTTTSPQTYNDILSGKGVLKTGVTSPAVGELQQKLLDLGYSAIAKPTNYFGTETLNAVKDFQEKNSLTVDGKVGGNTSKKIDQILDIRKRRSASQGEVIPGVPDTKLPDTSISGLSNQKTTTTTSTSPNTRGLTSAVQSYVPKGVSRTADFS
jgi:hypothetical protein